MVAATLVAAHGVAEGAIWIDSVDLGGLEARSAALLMTSQSTGAGSLSVYATTLPPDAGHQASDRQTVLVVVDVAAAWALGADPESIDILEFYAFAIGPEGDLLGTMTKAIELGPEAKHELTGRAGIKILAQLDLLPGRSTLRVMIQRRSTDQRVLSVLPIEVTAWSSEASTTALGAPILLEESAAWLLVRAFRDLDLRAIAGGDDRLPSTLPVWGRRTPEAWLFATTLPAGLELRVIDREGRIAARQAIVGERPATDSRRVRRWPIPFPAERPADGAYRLQLGDADTTELVSGPPIVVLPESAAAQIALWPQLSGLAGREVVVARAFGPEDRASDLVPLAGDEGGRRERIFTGYLNVVDLLEGGDSAGAVTLALELGAAELRFRTDRANRRRVVAPMESIAAEAVSRIVGRRGELMAPVIWVQCEAYRQSYQDRHNALAGLNRRTMIAIAERYLLAVPGKQSKRLVATAYASLASFLQESGNHLEAERIFLQALGLSPDDAPIQASLASIFEASGRWQEAADLLEEVVEKTPEDRESKLRLAVNLQRLGSTRRARKLFEQCLEDESADWVGALASQELAAAAIHQGDLAAAAALLGEAVERYPDYQRASIQLASVLDALGRPGEARTALERLEERATAEVDSPRLIYTRPPAGLASSWRSMLAAEARVRLAELAPLGARERSP